jgi:hypothetical protein
MKKIFLLVVVLLPYCFASSGPGDKIILKAEYLPNSVYTIASESNSEIEVSFIASYEMLNKLKESGIKNPSSIISHQTTMNSVITGKLNKDGVFPIETEIKNMVQENIINGVRNETGKANPLIGLKINGDYSKEKIFTNINISGGGINDELKKNLRVFLENLMKNIKYPDTPIAIGQSFSQITPMSIPIDKGLAIDLNLLGNYTLKKIESDKAYFVVLNELQIKQNNKSYTVSGSGGGKGELIQDIKNNCAFSFNSNLTMSFELKNDAITIIMKQSTKNSSKTSIRPAAQ